MRKFILLLLVYTCINVNGQQINGVFTDISRSQEWGNTVINTATQETSGYITLGGYYEGAASIKKIPILFQINSAGVIRSEFANGPFFISAVNSSSGSSQVDRTYIANTSSVVNSIQYIVSGHNDLGDGFLLKTFPTGSRPTAFNGGQITNLSGGGASAKGFIEDWVTGSFVYSVRMNGPTFGNARVLLTGFSRETGAAITTFGDNGTLRIAAPEGNIVDQSRPVKITKPSIGSYTDKFYVSFSTIASIGSQTDIVVYRININGGSIDSSFGTNGYKIFPTSSRYNVTNLVANSDESITVGGYGDEGMQSVPSFLTFKPDGSIVLTSYNYLLGEPNPGRGCKNVDGKRAIINGNERIVFAYAKPIDVDGHYRIAIASLSATDGAANDPINYNPWLGNDYISAEPTAIIALSGNTGFIVTGKATRSNGGLAGVVLKYTNSGALDPSFGTNGVLIIDGIQGGNPWDYVAQLPNNKYLAVGGASFIPGNLSQGGLLLSRFNQDGTADSSFGTNGSLYAYPSTYGRGGTDILPLANGQFLVGGTYFNYLNEPGIGTGSSGNRATVYKSNADGSPDYSFGPANNGRFHFAGSIGMSMGGIDMYGDHIYVQGNSSSNNSSGGRGLVLKLSSNGITVDIYQNSLTLQQAYTLDESTGNLYAGGNRTGTLPRLVCKVRPGNYPQAGVPDPTYGVNGLVEIPVVSAGESANIRELKLKPNGGLLAVLTWASGTTAPITYGVLFSSISAGGVVDASFGTNGTKFLQLPGATSIIAYRYKWVGANADKLMIFGEATVNGQPQGFVCKVNLEGELETGFGNNGVIWTTETFLGTIGFDNDGNALALRNYGFFRGGAIARLDIPASVYWSLQPGTWIGAVDDDWFKPANWAEGLVPGPFTAVTILSGSVSIGANMNAFAYSVTVSSGAQLRLGTNATLNITKDNP